MVRRDSRLAAGRHARRALLVGSQFAFLASAAHAWQEPDRPAGWLGVRVIQNYECAWDPGSAPKECDLVLDVSEVQQNGPAATGGLQPGDRMIAINGQDLTFRTWHGLRESMRAGTPVSIDVMRDDTRYFVRVTPRAKAPGIDAGRWVGTERTRTRESRETRPSVFVVTLTELDPREGGAAFAITVRDTEDDDVAFEPAALRVTESGLRLFPLSDETFVELPSLRREIMGNLRGITDSSYERASNAVQVVENIRSRLPSDGALRERLSRIAQVGLEEIQLATTFSRSWAGAQFVPAGRGLASAVEAEREGLMVIEVISNTPAARLGLRAGDIVFRAGEAWVRDVDDLAAAVEASRRRPIEIRWIRKGVEMSATYRR